MDAADPLHAASYATRLLCRTLGPAPASSPSEADEALFYGITGPLKGSKELVEQARMVMKDHGDTGMLYQDDGAQAAAAANSTKNQLRRRPAGDRKLHRFIINPPTSKPMTLMDRASLDNIADPGEFFETVDRFDEADKELKRINGEPTEKTFNLKARVTRRRKGSSRFSLFVGADSTNAIDIPTSQTETMTESQLPQDDAHDLISEKDEHSVPSTSRECAVPDVSVGEDLVSENDNSDPVTQLLTSFPSLEESEKQDCLLKTFGIEEISMEKVCPPDSVPADKALRRDTARTNPVKVHATERRLAGSHHARVSELEKRIFFIDAAKDKYMDLSEDDESEASPDILMGERSLMRDSSDVIVMTNETVSAKATDIETPSPCVKSAQCVHDPEPNMTDHATIDENEAGGSPLGLYTDTEITKENDPCSRHDISMEENDVTMDYSTKSKGATEISCHHVEGSSTEMLVSTPGRNVDPNDIARTTHAVEDNSQHQEVAEEDSIVQDKPTQSSETPLKNIDPQIQSHVPDGNIMKLAADLSNALSTAKAKTQKAVQKGKKKQQLKKVKKPTDESSHPLEISQENFDLANQPHTHDSNIENLPADLRNAVAPTKEKTQKTAQTGKKKRESKRGKEVSDEFSHPVQVPQENFDSENQPHAHDVHIEQQTVCMSSSLLPSKAKEQKEAQKRRKTEKMNKRKSLADAGLAWQSGVRRSTRIRSRPLEHWCGERFLYGRIHDTMATVIGIKAYSPGEDGKKALKVKSFVPEEYSDLVSKSGKY